MSFRVFHDSEARFEFLEAVARYEAESDGLGVRFTLEVKLALKRALDNPQRFPGVRGRAQKIRL